MIDILRDGLKTRQKALHNKVVFNKIRKKDIAARVNRRENARKMVEVVDRSIRLIEEIVSGRRDTIKGSIESIITEALRAIYGDELSISLEYSMKNNRSFVEIRLLKSTPSGIVSRKHGGFGEGVADTICVPLKLLILAKEPAVDSVLLVDEGFKHMDNVRIAKVGQLMRDISQKLGVQIIMCSHHKKLIEYSETVHDVTDVDGVAQVVRTK